jgi:hypothetical protein
VAPAGRRASRLNILANPKDFVEFFVPFDDEFKSLVSEFGQLLRTIVATIDRHGLKRRYLNKHTADVVELGSGSEKSRDFERKSSSTFWRKGFCEE